MRWLPLAVLLGVVVIVLAMGDKGSIAGLEAETFVPLVALLAMLVFMLGNPELRRYAGRLGEPTRDLAIWLGITFVLVAAYSYRQEASDLVARVTGELAPPGDAMTVDARAPGERAIRIRRRGDGHFIANALVDGVRIPMLVDTGASTIVLRQADATAMGIDIRNLSYSISVQTANGTTYAAAVRLRDVSIGPIQLKDLDALVAGPGALSESLLGLNFLRRLRSYEFSGDFLTLRS